MVDDGQVLGLASPCLGDAPATKTTRSQNQ
jgi:hypothetical protein